MFAIAGVTGNTGSVVANTLLSEGRGVRVLVRDEAKGAAWKAKGAEVAVADLHGEEAALRKAFEGVEGAYVLLPPLMRDDFLEVNTRSIQTIVSALKASRVPHVVLLSSLGAQHAAGTGPIVTVHRAEQAVRAAGLDATFVRAGSFMDNFASGLEPAAKDGILPTFFDPTYAMPTVASDDIGRTAARALLTPRRGQHIINLSAPEPASPDELAAALGRALGRPVKSLLIPEARIVDTLMGFGMPRGNAASMQEMVSGGSKGLYTFEPSGETMHGVISLDAFAMRLAATRKS